MESSSSPTQHILQLEDQLREKEKDVELAATIGQDLLNQVALLNSRVKELEAQRESTSTNNDNTTPKQQHPISKIPLPSSSNSSNPKKTVPNPPSVPQQQQLPHQQQQQHQQQQHQQHPNPTGSPFPRTPSKSKLLSNQLPPSPSTPATPLPYPEHKMDPNLAAQIENALVLQLRSLQAKLSTSESLRSKVSERCEAFERECTTIRSQNEKLANSERKLNERIWDLEILNQQLQETNETLEKEIARLLQKIKSQERDTSNMKDHVDALRLAEAGWNKEKETLLFKMESESSRKRREIAILKREKAELEKQIQELNQPMSVVEGGFQYKTGGSAASSTSDLARRAKSLEKLSDGKDDGEARSLQQQLQCQQQQQNSNNLFVNSLSKALSQAHTHNEELRRENADLLQSNEELDRLLQEAHETIESMKVGCDLSSLDRDQVFDPSFAVNQSVNLHDQLASSESMEDLLKFDLNLDLDKVQLPPTNLLAELTQADIDLAPAAEAMDSTEALPTAVVESNDLEPSDTVIEALSSRSHHQPIMSDFCCQTDDIPRFLLDTRSILNELTEIESIAPPPLPPGFLENSSFGDDDISFSGSFGSSIRSGSVAMPDNFDRSLLGQMSSTLQRNNTTGGFRARSPELVYGGRGLTRHRSEISFDHQTQEYVQYDSTAIEALTSTMIGTWFQKPNRHGKKPQLRFFWVNPYSRLLNWSHTASNASSGKGITKTAYIKQIKWMEPTDTHKNYPPDETHAIEIISRQRSILMIPLTWQDHRAWTAGLGLLLSKSAEGTGSGTDKTGNHGLTTIPLHERFKIVDMESSPVRRVAEGSGGTPLRRSFTQIADHSNTNNAFLEGRETIGSPQQQQRSKTPTPRMVPALESAGETTPGKERKPRGFSRLGFTPLRLSSTRSFSGNSPDVE